MLSIIREHIPSNWSPSDGALNEELLISNTGEFNNIKNEANEAGIALENPRIHRVQDIFSYGQFIIREQLLLVHHEHRPLYRVCTYTGTRRLIESHI